MAAAGELEGWRVEACADGRAAPARLEGGARYDVLFFDNELPGVSGLELARRARASSTQPDADHPDLGE